MRRYGGLARKRQELDRTERYGKLLLFIFRLHSLTFSLSISRPLSRLALNPRKMLQRRLLPPQRHPSPDRRFLRHHQQGRRAPPHGRRRSRHGRHDEVVQIAQQPHCDLGRHQLHQVKTQVDQGPLRCRKRRDPLRGEQVRGRGRDHVQHPRGQVDQPGLRGAGSRAGGAGLQAAHHNVREGV